MMVRYWINCLSARWLGKNKSKMDITPRQQAGKIIAGVNKMAFIKNIEHETVLPLADQVTVQPGQIVSRTLAQNKAVSITLFAFDKGEEISTHDSTGDAMVQVLEGKGKFTVGGKEHFCCVGDVLIMPAKVPHAVYAEETFKMLLTVVFPTEQE